MVILVLMSTRYLLSNIVWLFQDCSTDYLFNNGPIYLDATLQYFFCLGIKSGNSVSSKQSGISDQATLC